jgi:predicted kinase
MTNIILITGCPGSGKSTIGRALAEQFSHSIHIQVDSIRESIIKGFQAPGEWTPQGLRQFELARKVAIHWARVYQDDGYNVVIDDVCIPEAFTKHYAGLTTQPNVTRVLLNPNRDTLAQRITKRGGPYTEFFLTVAIPDVQGMIEVMPKEGWIIIDSSNLTIEETTRAVMQQLK